VAVARLAERGVVWLSTRRIVIVGGDSHGYEAIHNGEEESCSRWLVFGFHEEGWLLCWQKKTRQM